MLSIKKGCHVKSKYICYLTITVCKTIQNLVDFQGKGYQDQTFLKRISLLTVREGQQTNYQHTATTRSKPSGSAISFFNLFQCGGCVCGGGRVGVGGGNPPATHQSFQSSGNLEEIISFR